MDTPKFKVGDVVVREDSTIRREIIEMEWCEEDGTWYLKFHGDEEAEWNEQFYTLDKAWTEKLIEEKNRKPSQEIEDWVASHTCCDEVNGDDLKADLFYNTQSVIDMLQRYLDKKGK